MIEALGLATSAEIPIVVIDVMRGGPSTGIPTKSEQGDLNIAIYGMHGDAPHLVLAPQSVGDCVFTAQWATYLAEALQAPAIVLSDQFMGQSRAAIERPADVAFIGARSRRHRNRRRPTSATLWPPTACRRWRFRERAAVNIRPTASPIPSAARRPAARPTTSPSLTSGATSSSSFDFGDHWASVEGERRPRRHHLGIADRRRARSGRTAPPRMASTSA